MLLILSQGVRTERKTALGEMARTVSQAADLSVLSTRLLSYLTKVMLFGACPVPLGVMYQASLGVLLLLWGVCVYVYVCVVVFYFSVKTLPILL